MLWYIIYKDINYDHRPVYTSTTISSGEFAIS